MSKEFYIARAQVEQTVNGERKYINPGNPVWNLSEKEAERLLKVKAIRKPTEAEQELENLRAKSRGESDEDKSKKDESKKDEGGNGGNGGSTTSRRNRGNNGSDNSGI